MNHQHAGAEPWYRSRLNMVLLCFAAIVGFFLFTEHRAHVFGILPYLLLILCPLLHLFGHGGHGGHAGHESHEGHQHDKEKGENL